MPGYRIRFGDWCYLCGIPMVPASRIWVAALVPKGMRVHGSHGLCKPCLNLSYRDPSVLPADDEPKAVA